MFNYNSKNARKKGFCKVYSAFDLSQTDHPWLFIDNPEQ